MGKKIQNALFEALEKRAIMELIAMFENLNIIGNDERDTPNASMEHMHMSREGPTGFRRRGARPCWVNYIFNKQPNCDIILAYEGLEKSMTTGP